MIRIGKYIGIGNREFKNQFKKSRDGVIEKYGRTL